jgi:hypothetical protein
VADKRICAEFAQFSFIKWSLDAEEESNEPAAPFLPSEDDDFAFDVNAVPEPLPAEENDAPIDHFEGRILYFLSTHRMNKNAAKFFNYVGMSILICEKTTTLIFLDLELVHHFINRNL